MSMIDHDDIDRMRDAARMRSTSTSIPELVRRSDGKHFRIVLQARSINGPAELVACDGPPFESVHTTNDRLSLDFDDLPKSNSTSDKCARGNVCGWMRRAVEVRDTCDARFVRREMEHPDTLAKVVRYVVSLGGSVHIVRACPVCGGNPNEEIRYR